VNFSVGVRGGEGGVGDDGAVERRDRRHALDDEFVEGAAGPLQGLLARSRPVTMSLAIIESKAPAMVSPSTMPASQRTPGTTGG
jgi:hypothetical protein